MHKKYTKYCTQSITNWAKKGKGKKRDKKRIRKIKNKEKNNKKIKVIKK